jgi:AmmeMemoRadiSam system protein B
MWSAVMSAGQAGPPVVRQPFASGSFYPDEPAGLRRDVDSFLEPAEGGPREALGVIVPHAGYMYSGHVAGRVYATAKLPRRIIILGPNHMGLGDSVAVMNRGSWETPLGPAIIDEPLADLILKAAPMASADASAHRAEHSLEVQLPFLQVSIGNFVFTPICIGNESLSDLKKLAQALVTAIRELGEPVGIVISTDMTHYESAESAREKDQRIINEMKNLDSDQVHKLATNEEMSMCGFRAVTTGIEALKSLGASSSNLIAYANSGETSGDLKVVGYAGLLIQ